jgi:hypothetical protein
MNVFGYYVDIASLDPAGQLKLSIVWRERWSAAGFTPIILSDWHAQQHPFYREYSETISKFPSINPPTYSYHCFLRWLALAQVGGGLMSDLDLVPQCDGKDFLAYCDLRVAEHDTEVVCFQGHVPSLMLVPGPVRLKLCHAFMKPHVVTIDRKPGLPHAEDQFTLQRLIDEKVDWIETAELVKNFGDDGWREARFVHFNTDSCHGLGSKWKLIRENVKPLACSP